MIVNVLILIKQRNLSAIKSFFVFIIMNRVVFSCQALATISYKIDFI